MADKGKTDQSAEFICIAKEIGVDDEGSNADALLGKLAHAPPDPKPARKPNPRPVCILTESGFPTAGKSDSMR